MKPIASIILRHPPTPTTPDMHHKAFLEQLTKFMLTLPLTPLNRNPTRSPNPTSNPTKLYRSQRPLTRWNHVIRPRITQNHGKMHGIEVETDWNTLNPNPNPPVPSVPACTTLESVYRPCTEGHGVFTLSTVTLTRTTTPTHPSLRTVTLTFTLRQATLRQSPLTVRAMCS